jgi:hypothetical protein
LRLYYIHVTGHIYRIFFKVLDTKLFSYFQFIVAIIVIFVNISSCWVSVVYLHQDTYKKKLLKQAQNKPQTTNYTENMVCLSLSTPNFTKLVILREKNVVVIIPPFLVYNRICDSSNGIHVSNFVKLHFLAFSIRVLMYSNMSALKRYTVRLNSRLFCRGVNCIYLCMLASTTIFRLYYWRVVEQ